MRSWRSPEPVQRGVQIVLVGALDAKLRGKRGLAQQPRGGQLGTGAKTRWTISATARSRSRDAARSSSLARSTRRAIASTAFDVPGRQRPTDLKLVAADKPLPAQVTADQLDQPIGQMRQVGQHLPFDLAALTIGAAQQRRRVLQRRRTADTGVPLSIRIKPGELQPASHGD